VCPLRFANLFAVLQALRNNANTLPGLPTPTFTDFAVQGDALVSVLPAVTPTPTQPTPTPTKTHTYAPATASAGTHV
jgi:hypothetical protein